MIDDVDAGIFAPVLTIISVFQKQNGYHLTIDVGFCPGRNNLKNFRSVSSSRIAAFNASDKILIGGNISPKLKKMSYVWHNIYEKLHIGKPTLHRFEFM